MIRIILMYLIPFLLPLAVYTAFAWYRAKYVASHEGEAPVIERGPWPYLLLAGAFLTVATAGTMAILGGADPDATYTPARIEDGRVVPGTTN